MRKVSVIVAVYNSEKTIHKCIESILNQTLDDFEIVLVDDGSTDGSAKICDDYAEEHSNIKVVHKVNGGLVSARKAGIVVATGEYIGYVDGDDWIEPQMYKKLYHIAKKHDVDMVSSGYIYEGNYQSYECDTLDEGEYRGERLKELREKAIFNMEVQDLGIRGSLCCKLFRKESFQGAQLAIPDNISFSEDKACVLTYLLDCKSVYVLKDCYYHYILNTESMTIEPKTDYLSKINEVYRYLCSLYSHPNFSEDMRKQAELYITQLLIKGINSRMGFSIRNLMWIDSEWMYEVPEGASVLLIGAGALCDTYARQIENSGRLKLAGAVSECVDVANFKYDYVIITYKYEPKAEEVRRELTENGVPETKILWFEQKEIFWKYAKDAGLWRSLSD